MWSSIGTKETPAFWGSLFLDAPPHGNNSRKFNFWPFHISRKTQVRLLAADQLVTSPDEILHLPQKPWNAGRMIPLQITANGFPWLQGGGGFRPSTVPFCARCRRRSEDQVPQRTSVGHRPLSDSSSLAHGGTGSGGGKTGRLMSTGLLYGFVSKRPKWVGSCLTSLP